MDWFFTLIEKVLPPMTAIQTWRVLIGIFTIAFFFHIAWACGYVPGLDGFAQSLSVKSVEQQMVQVREENKKTVDQINVTQSAILARLIRADAEQARTEQCRAIKENNRTAAEGWRARLQVSLNEYRVSTGYDYVLRGCDEY